MSISVNTNKFSADDLLQKGRSLMMESGIFELNSNPDELSLLKYEPPSSEKSILKK